MAELPAALRQHEQRALRFEEQAEREMSAAAKLLIAEAVRRLAAEYLGAVGSLKAPVPAEAKQRVRDLVRRVMVALATGLISELPGLVEKLADIAERGLRLGAGVGPRPRRLQLRRSRDLAQAIAGLQRAIREELAAAERLARTMDLRSHGDVTTVLARANQAVNTIASTTRWVANRAVNEGAQAVADAAGVRRMWVAERDACLTCLAYAGELADPGEPFPAGLTYGDSSVVKTPIMSPPAHPSCRCRVVPWLGTEPQFGVELPTALKREAQRSVLRGDTNHASRPAKMRAADRLLKTGLSGLPDIVKIRARRKVKAGPRAWRPAKRTTR